MCAHAQTHKPAQNTCHLSLVYDEVLVFIVLWKMGLSVKPELMGPMGNYNFI